jgi:V/A-type H+-transporting ATPase subunit E
MPEQYPLTEELARDIEREREQILARAQQEGEAMLAEARTEGGRLTAAAREKLSRELAAVRSRTLARAKVEGRNALLEIRREAIDRVMTEVRQRLLEMEAKDPGGYGDLLWSLYTGGRGALPEGSLRVRLGAGGQAIRNRLAEEAGVAEVTEASGLHGVVLESGDGRVRCDLSLDALLTRVRSEYEAELASLLFEGGDERRIG